MAAVPKDLRPTNAKEREAFISYLSFVLDLKLTRNIGDILIEPCSPDKQAEYTEIQRADLEECLQVWRDKWTACDLHTPVIQCTPCRMNEQCISLTGAREFFKQLRDEQIENICEDFKLLFSKSVGKITNLRREVEPALTPPWGLLGLGSTMRDRFGRSGYYTINNYQTLYSKSHAVGKLAERLVEKGMLADAGEDDHRGDGGAGQQPYPVDTGSE